MCTCRHGTVPENFILISFISVCTSLLSDCVFKLSLGNPFGNPVFFYTDNARSCCVVFVFIAMNMQYLGHEIMTQADAGL